MRDEILKHLVLSTLVLFLVGLTAWMLKRQSASLRYRLWLFAAIKFAIPAGLLVSMGQWGQRLLPDGAWHVRANFFSSKAYLVAPTDTPSTAVSNENFWEMLTCVWALGAVACLVSWIILWLRQNTGNAQIPERAAQIVLKLRGKVGVGRPVRIRSAPVGSELGLAGIWHPVVVVPEGVCESLDEEELEAVLTHELVHARRWDNLTAVLVHALVCVFWFHPGLWWLERRLSAERELACDEAVIDTGADGEAYLSGILKLCQFGVRQLQAGICGVAGSTLRRRMERIMSYKPGGSQNRAAVVFILTMAALVVVLPFVLGFSTAPLAHAQAGSDSTKLMSCVFDGRVYAEGTTIEQDGMQQLCAVSGRRPMWVRSTTETQERSREVIQLPHHEIAVCEPKPSHSPKLCACQNGVYSPGSIVDSNQGPLACAAGKWSPFKPREGQAQ